MQYRDFLLEINVEELPVGYVRPALESLRNCLLRELNAAYVKCGALYTAGTADRLVCYIKDVSLYQETLSKEVIGPPKSIAFDKKGLPTKQGIGFAKSQGVKVEDLKVKNTARGEYVVIERKTKTRQTKEILKECIPRVIASIYFPKTMKWDLSDIRFARPIDSVLSLFGKEAIKIKLGSVPQKKISVISPDAYLKKIQKDELLDQDKRKNELEALILKAIKKLKGDQYVDERLLEEVNFMVSFPVIFIGTFDKKFLNLPEDVLKASMSKYQRLFPVSKKGGLINKFIAVVNGGGRDINKVRKGYENILDARLQDSLFFFEEDTRKPLSEEIARLKDLIFQKDLGNMLEKINRLEELCSFISEELSLKEDDKSYIKRAARLSKADLTTHMVGEFPSLQGVMGREYALRNGEKSQVAVAIGEQYLPHGIDGRLPETLCGSILALSDKIDNVVGFLGIGIEISGSYDPFGVRRNTHGLIQIIKYKSLRLRLDELIQKSIELYGARLRISMETLKDKIINYIKERIDFLMGDLKPIELKKAILEIKNLDILDIFNRHKALSCISNERFFLEAAKVVERTNNILKGVKDKGLEEVNERLFKEDLEEAVWRAYLDSKDRIQSLIEKEQYGEATRLYAHAFYKVLHDFFDKVLVNAEDRQLRLNRLALMKVINRLYTGRIADLALLPQIVVK